jgi:hypothetical protein
VRIDYIDKFNAESDAYHDAVIAMIAQKRKELAFLEHVERVIKLLKDTQWQATDAIVPDDERIPSMFRPKVESNTGEVK